MKFKTLICILLLLTLAVQLSACAQEETPAPSSAVQTSSRLGTVNLMADIQPRAVEVQAISAANAAASADFALALLQNSYAEENCVLSPYSVYLALAMTANGADADTLAQMESVLGMSCEALNAYLYTLAQGAGQELQSANSIWFYQNGAFVPNADFLQCNADYYSADVFGADFDEQTLRDINAWISEHTEGRIEDALDQIDPNTRMYLINALSFDAEWQSIYDVDQIYDGTFHAASGDESVQMMCSEEGKYLEDDLATGFIKDYSGGQYSYIALLPNEGVSVEEYLASLSGESLLATVQNATDVLVYATMPKYTLETKTELSEVLSAMGMPVAFSNDADFSRMANLELKIGRVLHQTYLSVDERGTEAGASTIVQMDAKGALIMETKTVVLDRPFVMGIYDNVNQTFLFLGVIESVA